MEIGDLKHVDIGKLGEDMEKHPERYTPWFRIALPRVLGHVEKTK